VANHCDPGSAAHNMSRAQKRSRFVEDTGGKPKKRRKVQNSAPAATTIISHENLQWREVAVPDRLEDAEGFLGLGIEEIEDVEVIRDPKSSRVQFRVKPP
jgi:ATP-dependent RNA helicase DDX24/MAK5